MKMSVVKYHSFCPAANEIEHNDVTKMVDIQNLFFLIKLTEFLFKFH